MRLSILAVSVPPLLFLALDASASDALRHGIELPGLFYTLRDVRDRGAEIQLIETRFESQDRVEGILRFERQVNVNVNSGEKLGTTTVLELEFNPAMAAETFERIGRPGPPRVSHEG